MTRAVFKYVTRVWRLLNDVSLRRHSCGLRVSKIMAVQNFAAWCSDEPRRWLPKRNDAADVTPSLKQAGSAEFISDPKPRGLRAFREGQVITSWCPSPIAYAALVDALPEAIAADAVHGESQLASIAYANPGAFQRIFNDHGGKGPGRPRGGGRHRGERSCRPTEMGHSLVEILPFGRTVH